MNENEIFIKFIVKKYCYILKFVELASAFEFENYRCTSNVKMEIVTMVLCLSTLKAYLTELLSYNTVKIFKNIVFAIFLKLL